MWLSGHRGESGGGFFTALLADTGLTKGVRYGETVHIRNRQQALQPPSAA